LDELKIESECSQGDHGFKYFQKLVRNIEDSEDIFTAPSEEKTIELDSLFKKTYCTAYDGT
jgi:hypothetical protein